MRDLNYLKILKNEGEVIIFNRTNSKSIRINEDVFELIKDVQSINKIYEISENCDVGDKDFFESLAKTFEKFNILDDWRKKVLHKIDFIITDFCNLKCTHCCYSAFYIDKDKFKQQKITTDIRILDAIIKLNPLQITLTGGEPLVVSNIEEVALFLKDNYKGIKSLASNATLITEKNVNLLSNCFDSFDISIDGINEEKCDKIRGIGTFNKVINSIKLLKKNNVKNISLSITLDNETMADRDPFVELCNQLDVTPITRIMNLKGRAKNNHISSDKILNFMDASTSNIASCYDCPGGINSFSVNYKGEVFPCNNFTSKEFKIGNILDNDLLDNLQWNKNFEWFKNFSVYIPDTRVECMDCEINTFCWNCPSVAYSFINNNNIKKLKEICKDKYNKIMEELWCE